MTTLMMIFGGCLIGLMVGLIDSGKPKKKNGWKPRYSPQKHVFNHDW